MSGFVTYQKFLQANSWVNYYYPGLLEQAAPVVGSPLRDLANKFFFLLFAMLRCIKWLNIGILRKAAFKTDLHHGVGLHLSGQHYGGYQAMVQKKFSRLAAAWFPDLLDGKLIDKLFPD